MELVASVQGPSGKKVALEFMSIKFATVGRSFKQTFFKSLCKLVFALDTICEIAGTVNSTYHGLGTVHYKRLAAAV